MKYKITIEDSNHPTLKYYPIPYCDTLEEVEETCQRVNEILPSSNARKFIIQNCNVYFCVHVERRDMDYTYTGLFKDMESASKLCESFNKMPGTYAWVGTVTKYKGDRMEVTCQ